MIYTHYHKLGNKKQTNCLLAMQCREKRIVKLGTTVEIQLSSRGHLLSTENIKVKLKVFGKGDNSLTCLKPLIA